MKKLLVTLMGVCMLISGPYAQTPASYGPVPSERQLKWQEMEYYFFIHFGPNTFTNLEWGKGTEHEEVFNPSQLDCRQWCRIAKAAGARGIIITAKHHDGFCLWPSKYSTHTIAQSKWKNGKGDVLQELKNACKEYGLKMGVYLSPWDRNHPAYGTSAYNDVYVNMMQEIIKKYGPFFEFWWDGANGEGPNGKKQIYDFKRFEKVMRDIAPNTAVFSDIGPDIRWVGNENGIAGEPNWDLLDTAGFTRGAGAPSTDTLNKGNVYGKNWIPEECDVSIRPGWFYHEQEDSAVKTPETLFQLYLKSVGRGSALLLNVPPDRRGLINEHDSAALAEFKKLRDESFGTPLLEKKFAINSQPAGETYSVKAVTAKPVNCIMLKEPVELGQRVQRFSVQLIMGDSVVKEIQGTTIGRKRILSFPFVDADGLRLNIQQSKATPLITEISGFFIRENLVER